jgi:hypothetical protein
MNRFRATFIALCCILAWLAYEDLSLLLRNPAPLKLSINELEALEQPPREWLTVTDGYPDLLRGINMTGSLEFSAFLVPLLTSSPDSRAVKVWFETRDPDILAALSTYYFNLETELERQAFLEQNSQLFSGQRQLTGMTAASFVAGNNERQLLKLLTQMGVPTDESPIFISEGKEPAVWRGIFFALAAVAGLTKLFLDQRRSTRPQD